MVALLDVCLGLEEEVFVLRPGSSRGASLESLFFLARLLWKRPLYYYTHSASNFARGLDLRHGLMGGVEVSTRVHRSAEDIVADLAALRRELASVCDGVIVPVGHLFDIETPTNTCGLHVHLGPFDGFRLECAYRNLARYLPLLALFTASSPVAGGRYFGQSYRIARCYAIGPLRVGDRRFRFQDMIVSKRLGTLELRIFDPVWDLARVRELLRVIVSVATCATLPGGSEGQPGWAEASYRRLRLEACREGLAASRDGRRPGEAGGGTDGEPRLASLMDELKVVCGGISEDMLVRTASDELHDVWMNNGTKATYELLDRAYRTGSFPTRPRGVSGGRALREDSGQVSRDDVAPPPCRGGLLGAARVLAGFVGYYAPRLPYIVYKGVRER